MFREEFDGRILPFDALAAAHYATLTAQRESLGRPISMANAQIAAICLSHEAILATRNGNDFSVPGLTLVNPWLE